MAAAAKSNLKKVSLELGGKSPVPSSIALAPRIAIDCVVLGPHLR